MFGGEYVALARSIPRMIFYRALMPDPPPAPAELPILLLHGVGCNAGVWSGFRRRLEQRGLGRSTRFRTARRLRPSNTSRPGRGTDKRHRVATGASQVVLVGHSMGGLVARAYLRQYGGAKVRRLITIGTPHHGSMHAWLMAGVSLAQMRPANAWLACSTATPTAFRGVDLVMARLDGLAIDIITH
jgi:triacylglycerol lipase